MTKELFLSELKKELTNASSNKIEVCVDDYSKRIDDMIEAGLSEEEAVAKQGRPCDIAKDRISELSAGSVHTFNQKKVWPITAVSFLLILLISAIWKYRMPVNNIHDIAFICLVFSIVMLIEAFLPLKALDKPQNIQISFIITFCIFAVLRTNQLTSDFSFSLVVLYSFLTVAVFSVAGLIAHVIINKKHSAGK
jgi:uncharacterized membrane protein